VIDIFGETKEWNRLSGGLKLTPLLTALIELETDRGQDLSVKTLRDFAILNPEIDVIEKTSAHKSDLSCRAANCRVWGAPASRKERRFVIAV
jgi:hypothetical protein